jgi:hypothetical protein
MGKYRLLRTVEYETLKSDLRKSQADVVTLLSTLSSARIGQASKSTMADMLTIRVNQLEHELATLKHHATGLPVMAASIGKGTPMQNAALGSGADLFEDVGDEAAETMRAAGLLHDESPVEALIAPARDLVGAIGE